MTAAAQNNEFDIVIAGAGMVGATLAHLLASSSMRVALIDRSDPAASNPNELQLSAEKFDSRVSAISHASQQLFNELGIWDEMEAKRVCNYRNMEVWDADGTGSISFSATEINQAQLGSIIENSIITAALHKGLARLQSVSTIYPFTIESYEQIEIEDQRYLQLNSSEGKFVRAKLVVAADGANSILRQLANFDCREWDYEQHALVTTVRTKKPHNYTALQRFLETGPLAFLPLRAAQNDDSQCYSSIVWSMLPEQAERIMALDEKIFNKELAAAIEFRLGDIEWSDRRFVFPLKQRHATDYYKENIVLIGDAAHTIHPLAGQGVNLGLLDAKVLAEELRRGVDAKRSVADPTVLLRYQRRRKGSNLSMMWLMEGFKRLFEQKNLSIRWIRNIGMNSLDSMTLIKNRMVRKAMGLDN